MVKSKHLVNVTKKTFNFYNDPVNTQEVDILEGEPITKPGLIPKSCFVFRALP